MKKFIIAVGLLSLAAGAYAACMGPFCWDDKGAYINGIVKDGNGDAHASKTVAQIKLIAPTVAGQVVFCSDCAAAGAKGTVCISTGTGVYAYSLSTGTACQ